ncbi:hypothetical protein QFC21_007176 [Naganishia friedmannii]|uniref:Uncharacterized protein n=1 Tax=Naganishia friedmannii TaxID=89922 RepID=A0ACC2UXS1_9TREE|nr:hypothetical protein QFC21_007176 [Naganishia friedmannii]
MATYLDIGYPARIQEEDTISLSSASIATSRHPESTRTFGSPSKNERTQYFNAPSMSRHLSESSQQSRAMSPFSFRYDPGKASPHNMVTLEREIDPLDTTSKPLQVVLPPFASPIGRRSSNHQSSATNSPHANTSEDLFPDDSLGSSQTSVQGDATHPNAKLESSEVPGIPPLVSTSVTNLIVLARPIAEPLPSAPPQTLLAPSTNSSPEIGSSISSSSRRVSRKQVPIWTSSLEDLEQSKALNTRHSVPVLGLPIFSPCRADGAESMQVAGRSLSLPHSNNLLSGDVGALERNARRLRIGHKERAPDGDLHEKQGIAGEPRLVERDYRRLGDAPQIPTRNHKEIRAAPGIPARSASLLKMEARNIDRKFTASGPQHPFDHFTYRHQSRDTAATADVQGHEYGKTSMEERRPSDQTFTSGFSLTRLTDEETPMWPATTERTTPSKRPVHSPEPLRGYEPGVRFSDQPIAGETFGKSQSENHLPLSNVGKAGNGAQSRNFRGMGMGGDPTKGRSMELFTLPEVSSMSVPLFHRGISNESARNNRRPSPRGSPMREQSSAFVPETAAHEKKTKPRLFQRRSRTKQRSTTDGVGMSSSDYASDASLSAASGGASSFGRGKRREKKIRRKREAAIFEAGPDRLPTPRELLAVSKLQVYNVDGEKVMFGDIVAGGGGVQTIVVFIRHWYCPLCAEYVECIIRTVDPETLERANVKLVIIGNGSRRMLPAYSKKVMRSPFEMYTDPKLRVYRALGMTKQTHDGGDEDDKGDYITKGAMRGTLEVAKRATKMPLGRPGTIPQLGGEFIFSSALQCSYAHRMTNTRAHAPIRDIVARTGALLDFIHVERGPPPPAIHRAPALPSYEAPDGMVFGNWGESGVEVTHAERDILEQRRTSEGEGWMVERERELERIRRDRVRRRSRLGEVGRMACEAEEGEGMTSGDEVRVV